MATLTAGSTIAAKASPATPVRRNSPRWGRRAMHWASLLLCIAVWHLLASQRVTLGWITFVNVPPPLEVLQAVRDLAQSPKLLFHLGHSLSRVFAGFFFAALFGIGLGLLIGRWQWAKNSLLPPLEVLRPIPAVAWIPLSILMFPSSEGSMIFIAFVGALFPILLNTIHGAETVDTRLIASARSLGTSPLRMFQVVILPAAAPAIVTGLAIAMGSCWFCLVAAEMISGQFGIGYFTWESYTLHNYANIVVGILLIGVLGMGSSVLIRKLGAWLMPWHKGATR